MKLYSGLSILSAVLSATSVRLVTKDSGSNAVQGTVNDFMLQGSLSVPNLCQENFLRQNKMIPIGHAPFKISAFDQHTPELFIYDKESIDVFMRFLEICKVTLESARSQLNVYREFGRTVTAADLNGAALPALTMLLPKIAPYVPAAEMGAVTIWGPYARECKEALQAAGVYNGLPQRFKAMLDTAIQAFN